MADKQRRCEQVLGQHEPRNWLAPVASAPVGFRNKAKLAVGGSVEHPTLGLLDAQFTGVDLANCRLYPPAIDAAFAPLRSFITAANLVPYAVATRRGELKFVLITANPAGELMVRLVLRSTESVARIRKHLPSLQASLPHARVITANIQPLPAAIIEGEQEIHLTAADTLPMVLDVSGSELTLNLRPNSFFQTNSMVATDLYARARDWVERVNPRNIWDLYCGVGGFALVCSRPAAGFALTANSPSDTAKNPVLQRRVVGVEISAEAIASAQASADEAGVDAQFITADAGTFACSHAPGDPALPELVIVNPPRRGIGPELAGWLEISGISSVIYSSCNPTSLAADLAIMGSYDAIEGQLFDMFPHTHHSEVAVLLQRRRP